MKLVLLGGPGAGKGTQATTLAKYFNVAHISTGDILREHIKNETPIGKQIQDIINNGNLVSNELMIELLMERIGRKDCENGFVLDGFPRTLYQAEMLDELAGHIDYIILIDVEDASVIERMSGRYTCPGCAAMYHLKYKPPLSPGVCDICNTTLVQREDDNIKTVENRLVIYHAQTLPIIQYFYDRIIRVNGMDSIESITESIIEKISMRK